MSLKEYKAKRNFAKTKEPSGKILKRASDLIYVIHKHAATHLHYDLRLEWKGVLMSWAVPKQPSKTGLKRLAVRVEDHPVEYAKFEGEIPAGEYGAGNVEIWDRGTWSPESFGKDKIVFDLRGEKMVGRFVLIKLENSDKNWLFFKLKSAA
jgi:bifunctional non-homologous end joining protein LigD